MTIMGTLTKILRYALIAMIVLLLGSLAGWYAYLQTQKNPLAPVEGEASMSDGFQGNRGGGAGSAVVSDTVTGGGEESISTKPIERLWRVDRGPVAGFSFVDRVLPLSSTSSTGSLFFVQRGTGYILSADTKTQVVSRITNTLMPKIYEAHIGTSGEYVFLRSVDETGALTTFAGTLVADDATGTPQALAGSYLSPNIREVALDSASKNMLLLTIDPATGNAIGTTQLQDGTKSKHLFSSFIRSWKPFYAQGQLILLTKPSDNLPGYAYKVSMAGTLSLLVGPIPGLSILPHPTENALLYSSSGGGVALFARAGSAAAVGIQLRTVADKCVWRRSSAKASDGQAEKMLIAYCAVPAAISSSSFLSDWYRGALHTEDAWWKINAVTGEVELLFTPPSPLDVQNPTIDKTSTYIAFTNGSDQSLWMLRLVQ